MPPVSPTRFEALFRGLSPDERTAFVAGLWTERDWETAIDGTTVTARQDGDTVRIEVANPGRFGTPALDEVDVLVVASDRDRVRAAAEAADVAYLTAKDVRDRLLYGLSRPAAAALFERTFEQPLDAPREPSPSLRERLQSAGSKVTAAGERVDSRLFLAIVLVAVVVGSVVVGPALTPTQEGAPVVVQNSSETPGDVGAVGERTETPTDSPIEESGPAPGLGEETVVDYVALARGHANAVVEDSRTLRISADGPPSAPFMHGRTAWNLTARVEFAQHYRYEARYRFPPDADESGLIEISRYADGQQGFRRYTVDNETSYHRYGLNQVGASGSYTANALEYLLVFLNGDDSSVRCVATLSGGDCFAYRVVVTGAPDSLPDGAADYRAVAVVQDNHVVSSLRVRYTLPVDGERVPATFQLSYDDLGRTTADPPDWLGAAMNATSN